MKKFLRNNSLSLVFILLFVITLFFQGMSGWKVYNKEREEDGYPKVSMQQYLNSGHFMSATFENWESEFLQMALFVVLTIFLYQKGSSESKDPEGGEEACDRKPNPRRKNAPWPVKAGGLWLWLYERSLTLALLLLFLLSWGAHFYGSFKNNNEELMRKGLPLETMSAYLTDENFWFESMQNWQSEFLSVFTIVVLSIYLRQRGSCQSKAVDAPYSETGE